MLDVYVTGTIPDPGLIIGRGHWLGEYFTLTTTKKPRAIRLDYTERPMARPYAVCPDRVVVTSWQSEGIAKYAGIDPHDYLMFFALLGLIEFRALQVNPDLKPHDLADLRTQYCVFTHRELFEEYALVFDDPYLCSSCAQFYCCIGCEREIFVLKNVLADFENLRQIPLPPMQSGTSDA